MQNRFPLDFINALIEKAHKRKVKYRGDLKKRKKKKKESLQIYWKRLSWKQPSSTLSLKKLARFNCGWDEQKIFINVTKWKQLFDNIKTQRLSNWLSYTVNIWPCFLNPCVFAWKRFYHFRLYAMLRIFNGMVNSETRY